jgi:hypothetical protein
VTVTVIDPFNPLANLHVISVSEYQLDASQTLPSTFIKLQYIDAPKLLPIRLTDTDPVVGEFARNTELKDTSSKVNNEDTVETLCKTVVAISFSAKPPSLGNRHIAVVSEIHPLAAQDDLPSLAAREFPNVPKDFPITSRNAT